MNSTILDGILETSMVNGVETNIKNALTDVGAKVPNDACLWDLSDIIRKTLVANTVNGINLKGKGGIKIDVKTENDILTYTLSTNVETFKLRRPEYANSNAYFGNDMPIQLLIDDLFDNILPKVKGVHAGDVTLSDTSGKDLKQWINTYSGAAGKKDGLIPNTKYLRLYLTSQDEPIYISLGNITEDVTGGYNMKSSDTVKIVIDNNSKEITANIEIINEEEIEKIYNI
jgi:hypothetical protein